jgi:hypothetical protein
MISLLDMQLFQFQFQLFYLAHQFLRLLAKQQAL